jgi:hypothetical protein
MTKLDPRSPASLPMATWWRSLRSVEVIGVVLGELVARVGQAVGGERIPGSAFVQVLGEGLRILPDQPVVGRRRLTHGLFPFQPASRFVEQREHGVRAGLSQCGRGGRMEG